jgi:hypothetical protein
MQLFDYFRKQEEDIFPFTRQKVGKYMREKGVFEDLQYPVEDTVSFYQGK